MAKLLSEDHDNKSCITLSALAQPEGSGELWQRVDVELSSGSQKIRFGEIAAGFQARGTPAKAALKPAEAPACLLCRAPIDEAGILVREIDLLLTGGKQAVVFEPLEPSFELSLESTDSGGIKCYAWIDAGNATSGFYTWDAAGVRFYTTRDKLKEFLRQLQADFGV